MLILVSLGLACIVIGIILGVLQFTSGAQHDANSLVHAVILMGSYRPTSDFLTSLLLIFKKVDS